MARTPEQDDVFFREVDDAVRKERASTAARRFGPALIVAVLLGLGSYAGWLWYVDYRADKAGQSAELYVQALDRVDAGNAAAASKTLADIAASDADGYAGAAVLLQANAALNKGDRKAAVTAFDRVIADAGTPQALRDLALVRKTAAEFDTLSPDAVIARLKPLAVKDSAWFGVAAEMTAIAYLKKGDRKRAGQIYADISADTDAAPTLKSRSVQMAGMLGIDAVVDAGRGQSGRPNRATAQ